MLTWPTYEQKRKIFDKLGYTPHPGQEPGHRSRAELLAVVGAERSGKSEFVAKEILARLPFCTEGVAVAAQEYDESHREMKYIIDGLRALGGLESSSTPKSGKWVATMRGGLTVETVSLKNGTEELTTTGDPFDIVCLVEWGVIQYAALDAAFGRTSETRGLVICAGTLKDNVGWQVDVYNALEGPNVYDGERFNFPAWLNTEIFPGGRHDSEIERLENTLPSEEFDRRVAALVVASPARIYPTFSHLEHVRDVGFAVDVPVEVWIDVGYFPSHYAVLAVQIYPEAFRLPEGSVVQMDVVYVIDEVWEHHLTHEEIYDLCREKWWWKEVALGVVGHEGKQHQAAASTEEVWNTLARSDGKVYRRWLSNGEMEERPFRVEVFDAGRVMDGIIRVKTFLKDPALKVPRIVLSKTCTGTAWEFGHYHRKTNTKGEVISEEPEDRNNDAMDALRNGIVRRFGLVDSEPRTPTPGKKRGRMRG